MLQILGCKWPQPVQWLLKAPTIHSCFLATLLKVYPDACLVVTHRRPVEVLPSWCKFVLSPMCATLWRHGTKRTLLRKKALEQLELFERIEQSIAAARETHGAQMFDVQCALGSRAAAAPLPLPLPRLCRARPRGVHSGQCWPGGPEGHQAACPRSPARHASR